MATLTLDCSKATTAQVQQLEAHHAALASYLQEEKRALDNSLTVQRLSRASPPTAATPNRHRVSSVLHMFKIVAR